MPEGHTKTVDHCAVRRARGGALDVHVSPAPSIYVRVAAELRVRPTYIYIYIHEIKRFPAFARLPMCAVGASLCAPTLALLCRRRDARALSLAASALPYVLTRPSTKL